MNARRLGSLTLGIVLCAAGILVAMPASSGGLLAWLARGWPAFLVAGGVASLTGFALRRRPASPFCGAVLLAGGGLLLAFSLWSSAGLLEFYGRWWPLLIGVVALVELLRHYTRRPELGERPAIVTGGKIALVCLIAVTGLFAQRIAAVNPNVVARLEMPPALAELRDSFFGEVFSFDPLRESVDLPPGGVLEIANRFGDLEVTGTDGERVEVELAPRVRAYDRASAAQVVGQLRLRLMVGATAITVDTNRNEIDREMTTDMVVRVPRRAGIHVVHAHGTVTIAGVEPAIGGLRVETSHAPVTIRDVRAAIEVENHHGSLLVARAAGSLRVEAPYTDVTITDFDGTVDLDGVDDVALTNVRGAHVRLVNVDRAHVAAHQLEAGEVAISGAHSDMDLEDVTGDVNIVASHADVRAVDISGFLSIDAQHTSVEVVRARALKILTSHDDVRVSDVRGPQDVVNNHGAIEIRLPRGPRFRVQTEVEHGEARVDGALDNPAVPGAIPINLKTTFDDIVVEPSATVISVGSV